MLATGRPRRRRRRTGLRRLGLAVAVAALLVAGGAWAETRGGDDARTATRAAASPDATTAAPAGSPSAAGHAPKDRPRLGVTPLGRLPQAPPDPRGPGSGGAAPPSARP